MNIASLDFNIHQQYKKNCVYLLKWSKTYGNSDLSIKLYMDIQVEFNYKNWAVMVTTIYIVVYNITKTYQIWTLNKTFNVSVEVIS